MNETYTVRESEMSEVAARVLSALTNKQMKRARVLLLQGDLGAGKTTFTKELAVLLGIEKEEVHSPTFILKKEYKGDHQIFKKLIHIDAYRFNTKDEGKVLMVANDMSDERAIIAIEWPARMHHPEADMVVDFVVIDGETRNVTISEIEHKKQDRNTAAGSLVTKQIENEDSVEAPSESHKTQKVGKDMESITVPKEKMDISLRFKQMMGESPDKEKQKAGVGTFRV